MSRALSALILITLFAKASLSQNGVYPDNGTLYDGKLHSVMIIMHPDSLDALMSSENRWTNHRYPATFIYDEKDTLYNVGIRIKGNSSRNAKKLSIKIDTDEFTDQDYQGLKTFNFNGNHNDPSLVRENLSTHVMRNAGVISLRANHITLYINGVYRGVYSNTEHINKKFLTSRFGNNSGNLYKCSWPADLNWLGNNEQSYKNVINPSPLNERAYELKTNEDKDDYSDLVALINTINNTPEELFKNAIDTIFDVESYLKTLAAEVLIGHWDNYFFNKNNYYLYHNPATKKFVYLPYDMDNTFGVQWGVENINERHVLDWGKKENAPLTYKILNVPEYRQLYINNLRELCVSGFNSTKLFPRIDSIKTYLTDPVSADSFYTQKWESDYGFTVNDWNISFTQKVADHATYGIKPFIERRAASAIEQITTGISANAINTKIDFYPNPANNMILIYTSGNSVLEIFDVNGKVLLNQLLKTGINSIDISSANNGIYNLLLNEDGDTKTSRLIIK